MKKTLLLLALICSVTNYAQTVGDTFTSGDLNYTVTNETPFEVEVSGQTGGLTAITIPETVTDNATATTFSVVAIGANAFLSDITLETVSLPSTVVTLKDKAFQKCNVLTTLGDTSNIETIGSGVFLDCFVLASFDASSLTSLGGNSFRECRAIESLVFPVLTTAVGNATNRMPNIKESHWPAIETFGNYNVYQCESLTDLYLGSTLTAFEAQTFHSAGTFLLHIDNDTPIDATILSTDHDVSGVTVVVPTAAGVTAYDSAPGWDRFADVISQSELLTAVGYTFTEGDYTYTVTNNSPLEVGLSGASVTALDVPASVTSSTITYSVTSVVANAFEGDSNITSVNLPSTVKEIGAWAFSGCSSLTSLDTADITIIGSNILRGTNGITTLDLSSVTTIDSNGLGRVTNLTGVLDLPNIETLGPYAFVGPDTADGTHITGLNLGGSLTEVNTFAFYRLRDLSLLTVATDTPPALADGATTFDLNSTPSSGLVSDISFEVPTPTGVSNYSMADGWSQFTNISDNASLSSETIDAKSLGFAIYPNPAMESISIRNAESLDAKIEVSDLNGRILINKNVNNNLTEINISNFKSGMYLFKIKTQESEFVKRVVKQ
ncbi:leucine-rich repeat domain-containing protein [Tamlana sp. 62-3]|uniref:Leucine-rich repeat domain-containing protein n=1 Tax=Neotamlana sargassicola TaxID=2883125 RepID=A0A9X1I710_9FLAO|nr:leucine-rich repeat protein [Tamlana sargassicola]MCB4807959.1 leucine-rich repeat domain-containing protein [Tamlana sargassicola]